MHTSGDEKPGATNARRPTAGEDPVAFHARDDFERGARHCIGFFVELESGGKTLEKENERKCNEDMVRRVIVREAASEGEIECENVSARM
jgi:hypothetical protein